MSIRVSRGKASDKLDGQSARVRTDGGVEGDPVFSGTVDRFTTTRAFPVVLKTKCILGRTYFAPSLADSTQFALRDERVVSGI